MSNAATVIVSSGMSTSGAAAIEKVSEERAFKMQFVLVGFTQDAGFRVFAFEGIGEDRMRTKFTVRADLALIRGYEIRVQELPLLCRGLLERVTQITSEVTGEEPATRESASPGSALREPAPQESASQKNTWIFTEEEMRLHASGCAEARDAAQRKKSMRRFGLNQPGAGSRSPQAW
jgi:hypothetical protein